MTNLRPDAARPNPLDGDLRVENPSTLDARGDGGAGHDESAADEWYRLISIDAVRTPKGCVGKDWHVYRIARGENAITGYRCGDLARTRADVEAIVAALNGRRRWTKSGATSKSQRRAAAAARRAAPK